MSIEEIIKVLEQERACVARQGDGGCDRDCARCDLLMDDKVILEAYDAAIALLRTHPDAQPNEPLTLEELREMDGQPVWVERGPGYEGRWVLVQVWAKSTDIIYLIQANGSVLHLGVEINNGAKIYRHPPKEE